MALNNTSIADTIKQSASQAKSTAATSTSLVSTTAKDTLVAVDAYGKSTKDVLSSMKNGILDKLNATKNWLLNTSIGDLGSLNDAIATAKSVKDDATALTNQLNNTIGQSISTVKGITDEVVSTATSTLNEIDQAVNDTFNTVNGAAVTVTQGANALTLNNFLSSVNTLINDAKYKFDSLEDKFSNTALKASILQNASSLGLTNVITTVYNSDPGNVTLMAALSDGLSEALATGNLATIGTIVDTLGVDYCKTKIPTIVTLILQNYNWPVGTTANEYSSEATKLITLLNKLNPSWNKAIDAPYLSHNLSVFNLASSKTKTILMTMPEYAYQLKVITHYQSTDLLAVARSMYPEGAFR